jgi:catechol 2,3-dioxygenase-like lactoylglutathione lyase family enzyme
MQRMIYLTMALGLSLASATFGADLASPAKPPQAGMGPPTLAIDHNSLGVADIDKMAEWYHRVLGFEAAPRRHIENYDIQRLTIPGVYYLNLMQQPGSVRPAAVMDMDKQGLMSITFGTGDADAVYRWLVSQGVNILRVAKNAQGKVTSMHFTDPEGNHLEIAQR